MRLADAVDHAVFFGPGYCRSTGILRRDILEGRFLHGYSFPSQGPIQGIETRHKPNPGFIAGAAKCFALR